ncbi:MAG TPA: sigma-70 family RNA polymerase sigma factor [Candidatus Saccharimonadales bacterium]|nr:sigma-70 family RNA polymerase sigma factor [Candidatus Saccharimonadales bacterium]
MDEREFATWIDPLRAGRPDAVAWMFANFRGDVERCFGRRPPEDRADLVQDVFAVAITRLHTFEGDREATLRAWLRSIAFHRWHHRWEADQVRARHSGPALEVLLETNPGHHAFRDLGTDPSSAVCQSEMVRALLCLLTPGQARVVQAHLVEGRTTREIASDWGVPRERVRGLYKRAICKLRRSDCGDWLREAA